MRLWNGIRVGVVVAMLGALIAPGVAAAADLRVTTTADADDKECVADCTLREAVSLAGPDDRVILPNGNYVLTAGELFLTSDTIVGENARMTFIGANNESRVLWVTDGTTRVSGVTIRNGNSVGRDPGGAGGGIYVQSGLLILTDVAVTANTATTGGGIATAGTAFLFNTTVSGNTAESGRLTRGGGIAVASTGGLGLGNSTVSNNRAVDQVGAASQGGGVYSAGSLSLINATIAGNNATEGGGLYVVAPPTGSPNADDSILAAGTGGACGGPGVPAMTGDHNIASDDSCSFKGTRNRLSTNPLLAGLTNNGGPTNTHALLPASPAINTAGACTTTDQRGVARPQPAGGLCDVGAFEYRAPTLRVVTNVVNDSGGSGTPDAFKVHVRLGVTDVPGSPQPGTDKGSTYTLDAGQTYSVVVDAPAGYSFAIGNDCAPNGNVGLAEGQNKTCTIAANDIAPTLRVVTTVINDDGGDLTAGAVDVHVRRGGTDVTGSPKDGTGAPGAQYTVTAGAHTVSADPVAGYSVSYGGDCEANGSIALGLADNRSCTVTLDDGASTLTVATSVVNDDGGTALPGDFDVAVKLAGAVIANQPGSPGTAYALAGNRSYLVHAGGVPGYAVAYSGGCASDGSLTLPLGQDRSCTITADDVAPTLTVVTNVVNDNGGSAGPAAFSVHVRAGGADVPGSPQPGSASGTAYTLDSGVAYAVAADALAGYASDGCSVTLSPGQNATCTITANDDAPPVQGEQALPPPVVGVNINALPSSGKVRYKLPGATAYVTLAEGEQVPVGTIIDVLKGRVTLVASDGKGGTAAAGFYGGIIKLGQTKAGLTVLTLVEKLSCTTKGKKASASAKKKTKRRLWGDGSGRFQTKGKHSAATVVGTKWLVEDTCTATLTKVAKGRVSVRDFVLKKTVIVKAGKTYVARANAR